MGELSLLSSRKKRIAVSATDVETHAFPMLLPHRVTVSLMVSYLDPKLADATERQIKERLEQSLFHCELETVSDRPPLRERKKQSPLAKELLDLGEKLGTDLEKGSSVWPSAGGLVPDRIPVVCGVGPVAQDLYTPHECVQRISLMQRTLLIARFLAKDL